HQGEVAPDGTRGATVYPAVFRAGAGVEVLNSCPAGGHPTLRPPGRLRRRDGPVAAAGVIGFDGDSTRQPILSSLHDPTTRQERGRSPYPQEYEGVPVTNTCRVRDPKQPDGTRQARRPLWVCRVPSGCVG